VIVDAGPLVALALRSDPDHRRCAESAAGIAGGLVTTWPVFTEVAYLLGRRSGWDAQNRLFQTVLGGAIGIEAPDDEMVARMHELMRKYRDVPMDLADASLVALAERRGEVDIFTLDSDFEVYRMGRRAFRLWPR